MPASRGLADEEAAHALRSFRQVFNAVKTHFQQMEKRSGLGGSQVWALSIIAEQPGIGAGALAQGMDIHQSTASNLIKGLVERGYVEAKKSSVDRRSVHLNLLPAGRNALKKAPLPFSGVLPDALAQMEPAALKSLNRDLDQLLSVLKKVDAHAAQLPLADL